MALLDGREPDADTATERAGDTAGREREQDIDTLKLALQYVIGESRCDTGVTGWSRAGECGHYGGRWLYERFLFLLHSVT